MNAVEFLRAVWPAKGLYCVVIQTPGDTRPINKHYGFDAPEKAAAFALQNTIDPVKTVYYAVHTLKGRVTHTLEDGKTYERVKRTADNMLGAQCFYVDVDCGWDATKNCWKDYKNRTEGREGLIAFLETTGLPVPLVVGSGNGLHIYWLLTEMVSSEVWAKYAEILKRLAQHLRFHVDPSCTADVTRVLRPVGTFHRKDPANPRKVKVLGSAPQRVTPEQFFALLEAAAAQLPSEEVREAAELPEAERPTPMAVAKACPTFQKLVVDAPKATGLQWMNTNMIAIHTTGGAAMAHKLASSHPTYNKKETQAKLDRLFDRNIGPPTCGKLQELYGKESPCPKCTFYGSPMSSPVVFARRLPAALPAELPQPLPPYFRTSRGVEFKPPAPPDALVQPPNQVICDYDLYPIMLVDEAINETKGMLWTAVIPHKGGLSFRLPADCYADENRLISALAHRGVFVDKRHAKTLGGYMSHYIKQLQQHQKEHEQHDTFGWTLDHKQFLHGTSMFTAHAPPRPAVLSPNLGNVVQTMGKAGTIAGQVKAMTFYEDRSYVVQQFITGSSLGATLFFMTDLYGVICNVTGPSGASKSTALYSGLGFWGRGDKFALGGTEDDATANGRAGRIRMLANLPCGVDEITLMAADQVRRMAMSITQPTVAKVKQGRNGFEKPIPDALKSTAMICTSNTSAHQLLAVGNQAGSAGSMRVLELNAKRNSLHTKQQAEAFWRACLENHGHIGPVFIQYVLDHQDEVRAELTQLRAELDRRANVQQEERFWAAMICVTVMALKIAKRLGLLNYDTDYMMEWAADELLPANRRIVGMSYAEPVDILQTYIEHITNNMLVVEEDRSGPKGSRGHSVWLVTRKPLGGGLKARLEQGTGNLYLSPEPMRDWCDQRKIVFDAVLQQLVHKGVIEREKMKLGRYVAEYELAQRWNLRVNLNHELMAGSAPIEVGGKVVHLYPAKTEVASST